MGGGIGQHEARREAGFSLIELLVVIAIVSVLAVGASMAVTRRAGGGEGSDLAAFRAAWEAQRGLAIEGREMRGLAIAAKGMRAMVWRLGPEGLGGWQAAGRERRWRGGAGFAAERPVPSGAPEIVFLPSGQSSGFTLRLGEDGATCESDGWTGLTCG